MRRLRIFAALLLVLGLLSVVPAAAQGERSDAQLSGVTDRDDLLSESDEQAVNRALLEASEAADVPVCAYVFASEYTYSGYEEYWGEDFLAEHGLSKSTDLILLVVTVTSYEVYYDIYTYGDASRRINSKEIDYILDDDRVYNNLKGGRLAEGLCAYAALSGEAYAGRLGISWQLILIGSLAAGAVVALISVMSIRASYKRKNPSASYPLDRFAKLELTHKDDREIGRFVTTTVISTGGHGGRGGGRMGGGSGHRGGR